MNEAKREKMKNNQSANVDESYIKTLYNRKIINKSTKYRNFERTDYIKSDCKTKEVRQVNLLHFFPALHSVVSHYRNHPKNSSEQHY